MSSSQFEPIPMMSDAPAPAPAAAPQEQASPIRDAIQEAISALNVGAVRVVDDANDGEF